MLNTYHKKLQNPNPEIGDAGFKRVLWTFKQQLALKNAKTL